MCYLHEASWHVDIAVDGQPRSVAAMKHACPHVPRITVNGPMDNTFTSIVSVFTFTLSSPLPVCSKFVETFQNDWALQTITNHVKWHYSMLPLLTMAVRWLPVPNVPCQPLLLALGSRHAAHGRQEPLSKTSKTPAPLPLRHSIQIMLIVTATNRNLYPCQNFIVSHVGH